ncbi:hypothetical protein KR026_007137 [Drosophila bipectinata]|nr:hypothetical protein KR026_007137 [Drosophila bipectinata]
MLPESKNGITIRIMTVEDYKEVKHFMRDHFYYDEPFGIGINVPLHLQNEAEEDQHHLDMIRQGLSLIATEDSNPEHVVGIVLAEKLEPHDVEKNRIYAEDKEDNLLGRILRLMAKVEREANVFEHYGVTSFLNSYITAVAAPARGKGLGSRLASTLIELGRSRGFPVMAAYCTSHYSAQQKDALGMECIYTLAYADYKDDQGRGMFTPPPPHTHIRVMAMKL